MVNNCDISIELADDNEVYVPGDTVPGTVHVEVNKDCRCDGLALSLEWYTHGRGNTAKEEVDRDRLFQGEWTAGEHHEHDFEMPLPPGPYTYHGNYLNVDWRLKAEADIPWALDPTAEQELILEPSGTEEELRMGDRQLAKHGLPSRGQLRSWMSTLMGGVLLVGGLIGLAVLALMGNYGGILVPVIGIILGGFLTHNAIRKYLAERRLGEAAVQLKPAETGRGEASQRDVEEALPDSVDVNEGAARLLEKVQSAPAADAEPGEEIRCRVVLDPPSTITVNDITARLHAYERVVSGSGTNQTTYTHTVYEDTRTLLGSEQATVRGALRTFKTDIKVPDAAPFSFHASNNELMWEVEVHIDIPWWPDWTHAEPLTVRPGTEPEHPRR